MHPDTRLVAAQLFKQAMRGQPPSAGPRLLIVAGPDAGRTLPVSEGDTLGRGSAAQVPLRDPAASRSHARVERRDGQLAIVDLGSKNGIELNGRRVRSRATLREGDRLRVGATLLEAAGLGDLTAPASIRGHERERCDGPGTSPRRLARPAAAMLLAAAAVLALVGM